MCAVVSERAHSVRTVKNIASDFNSSTAHEHTTITNRSCSIIRKTCVNWHAIALTLYNYEMSNGISKILVHLCIAHKHVITGSETNKKYLLKYILWMYLRKFTITEFIFTIILVYASSGLGSFLTVNHDDTKQWHFSDVMHCCESALKNVVCQQRCGWDI